MAASEPATEGGRIEAIERELAELRHENTELKAKLGKRRVGGRQIAAGVLLIFALLAVLPAEILLWANRTFMNTDNYVQTVAPVIHQPAVQQAITKYATDNLFATVNIQQEVEQFLPAQAQPLAAPVASQVQGYITKAAARLVATDKFAQLWANVNQRVQTRFVAIAQNPNASPSININDIYSFISQNLSGTGLGFLAGHQLPPKVSQITIITIPALSKIPYYVATFDDLRWLFVGLAVGLSVLALAVATRRRRMALWIGVGWMAVTVFGVITVRLIRNALLVNIPDTTYRAAASDIWQALLRPLYEQAVVLFAAGAIIAAAAWLLGPTEIAVRSRVGLQGLLAHWRTSLFPQLETAGWNVGLRRHHNQALWVLLLLTLGVLLLLIPLTLPELVMVAVGAALVWVVLEFLVARADPGSNAGPPVTEAAPPP